MTDSTVHGLVRRVQWKSSLLVTVCVVVAAIVLSSTMWLQVRVVQLTGGLRHATEHIAAQQKTLGSQQQQIAVTQQRDAEANCKSVNVGFATSRALANEEALVQTSQAIKLYQRSVQTLAVNPPQNAAARRARAISDAFLRSIVADTVTLSYKAIRDTEARTKPLSCESLNTRLRPPI